MRLATVRREAEPVPVIERDDGVLLSVAELLGRAPLSLLDIITTPDALTRIRQALSAASADLDLIDPATAEWLPPLPAPGKICCVAMNNSASNSRKISAPDHPAFFFKPASALIGHNGTIQLQRHYGSVHPEPELAVVIGSCLKRANPEESLSGVFGYTILNDLTGNDMRAEDRFHYYALYQDSENPEQLERREQHLSYTARYKGCDGFAPMGPFIVTADEVPNPNRLRVECRVDDDLVAEDSTEFYNFTIQEVLAFLSHFQTLRPGDVVSMGTAFRTSAGKTRSIHHANLQQASNVSVSVEHIGVLRNTISHHDDGAPAWRL